MIAHQGDSADQLFMISRGCARYFYITPEGKKIILFWLTAGQIFGASAILSEPSEYLVSAEAVRDSQLFVWHRSKIRALAVRFPRL